VNAQSFALVTTAAFAAAALMIGLAISALLQSL